MPRDLTFLCLGGPENANRLPLREARRLGYRSASDAERHAWNDEPIVCWDEPGFVEAMATLELACK